MPIKDHEKQIILTNNIYSFDIFDTLITRLVPNPRGIFSIIQEKLINNKYYMDFPDFIRYNFASIRLKAEQYAYFINNQKGIQEISFDEIYDIVSYNNNLTTYQIKKLQILEIETELQNLTGIKINIQKVKDLINEGNTVVLISDMYYSSEVVRKFLTCIDKIFENIPIVMSSEFKLKKSTGDLYKFLSKKYNINNWEHFGDNHLADVKQAFKCGISAKEFKFPKLYEFEKCFLDKNPESYFLHSIGISKICRINNNKSYCLGASYTGPIFFPYVNWILEQALLRGISRLYFVARDGFVLKEIADIIISVNNLNIKTFYIYGSRAAWRIKENDNNKELLIGYLSQEIDFSDDKFAFVEFQGTGKTQDSLNNLIKDIYNKNIQTFFYSLDNSDQFNKKSLKFIYNNIQNAYLTEILLRADHGCTLGYKFEDNKYIPLFDEFETEKLKNSDFYDYLQGIKDYTKILINIEKDSKYLTSNKMSEFYLSLLKTDKISELSEVLGEISFSTKAGKNKMSKYAPKISFLEALLIIFSLKKYDGTNIYVSINRTNKFAKPFLKFIQKFENIYKFLFKIHINKKSKIAKVRIFGENISIRKLLWK